MSWDVIDVDFPNFWEVVDVSWDSGPLVTDL